MATETSTTGLLAAACGGDERAFAGLVQRRATRLLALVHRFAAPAIRRGDCGAEDLLQEALLKAWQLLPTAEPRDGAGFSRWLAAIVRNVVRDRVSYRSGHGRDGARHLESVPGVAGRLLASLTSITEAAGRREQIERALDALASLPPRQRAVVEAHVLHCQSIREIASELGVAPNAVWDRLQRGLRTLRARLDGGDRSPRPADDRQRPGE